MNSLFYKLMRYYPPFLGAGIYIEKSNSDGSDLTVAMKLRFYNKNAVKTQFGGSLYAMCDPWYMFIISAYLGKDYIVWDKAANIKFKRPGISKVTARFHLTQEQLQEIKRRVDSGDQTDFEYTTEVLGSQSEVVAEVHKTLYVNTKKGHKERLAYHANKRSES